MTPFGRAASHSLAPEGTLQRTLFDPRTGQARRVLLDADEADIERAVTAARAALSRWAGLTPRQRGDRLSGLAHVIEEAADELLAAEMAGTGKPLSEAHAELAQTADLFRFFAGAARAELSPAAGGLIAGHESWVRWEPLGVVAAVLPWNYPLLMLGWRCAPALAAGNTVVVKPAETTPDSALLLAEYATELLGPGVISVVPGGRETGRRLCEADIDAIAFTGSARAGNEVVASAGTRRVSLELGGNGPVIVLPDAPDTAWADLADATTYNAGQNCAAPARVIAVGCAETVEEELGDALRQKVAGPDFGPLNNPAQVAHYDRLLCGESLAAAGTVDPGAPSDAYFRPTALVTDCRPHSAVVLDEVFGPVLTLQEVPTLDEAVRLANAVPQALAASVWTRAIDAALAIAPRLHAGEVWVNCHLAQTAELPHGGRGSSGTGTDLSVLALAEYRRPKTVTVRVGLPHAT